MNNEGDNMTFECHVSKDCEAKRVYNVFKQHIATPKIQDAEVR